MILNVHFYSKLFPHCRTLYLALSFTHTHKHRHTYNCLYQYLPEQQKVKKTPFVSSQLVFFQQNHLYGGLCLSLIQLSTHYVIHIFPCMRCMQYISSPLATFVFGINQRKQYPKRSSSLQRDCKTYTHMARFLLLLKIKCPRYIIFLCKSPPHEHKNIYLYLSICIAVLSHTVVKSNYTSPRTSGILLENYTHVALDLFQEFSGVQSHLVFITVL